MSSEPPPGGGTRRRRWGRLGPGAMCRLINDPGFVEELKAAEVVLGMDVKDRGNEGLFFGRRVPEAAGRGVRVLRVPIDFDTDDPEVLAAACARWKGSYCYRGGPGGGP